MSARRKQLSKRREMIENAAAERGLTVHTYSPGDGVTRYRFFEDAPEGQDYFGPANGLYTALGLTEALQYLSAIRAAPRSNSQPSE